MPTKMEREDLLHDHELSQLWPLKFGYSVVVYYNLMLFSKLIQQQSAIATRSFLKETLQVPYLKLLLLLLKTKTSLLIKVN